MKTSFRLLLASAAFLIGVTSARCAPGNSASINLTGTLASGKSIIVTSGAETIKPARVYHYAITGTCHGTGDFAFVISPGTDLGTVIGQIDPALSPYLQGTVLDAPGTLPFVCVNKLAKGSFSFFGNTVTGQVQADAGITSTGVCYGKFLNLLFTVNGVTDTTDTIVIDQGKCLVQISPFSGLARPNLSFVSAIGHLNGIGSNGIASPSHVGTVSLAKGASASSVVVLQNIGSVAGTFKLNATAVAPGFTQKFIYQTLDRTIAVTHPVGLTIPSAGTLAGGVAATLTWQITNVSAAAGATIAPVLTAAVVPPAGGVVYKDSLKISGTAE